MRKYVSDMYQYASKNMYQYSAKLHNQYQAKIASISNIFILELNA